MCYRVSQSIVISMKRYLYPIQRDDIATSHKLWKPTEKVIIHRPDKSLQVKNGGL